MKKVEERALQRAENAVYNLNRWPIRKKEDESEIEKIRREQHEDNLQIWEFILKAVQHFTKERNNGR